MSSSFPYSRSGVCVLPVVFITEVLRVSGLRGVFFSEAVKSILQQQWEEQPLP